MDPMQNPTPTPNPVPPAPMPGPAPAPMASSAPAPAPTPAPTPAPAPALNPASAPAPMPGVNPVVNTVDTSAFENVAPVSPLSATEPLTQPEPAPAPDPVEEALKAPFKPADPVPGSIGSAVSMGQPAPNMPNTPNVPFNDPAAAPAPAPAKKKSNKTLIVLCIIAVVIVAALGVVLAMQMLMPASQQTKPNNNTNNNSSSKVEEEKKETAEEKTPVVTNSVLSCTRTLAAADLAKYEGATSGVETLVANYTDDELDSIKINLSLVFPDDTSAKTGLTAAKANYTEEYTALNLEADPFNSSYDQINGKVTVAHEASLTVLDEKNAKIFNIDSNGTEKLDTTGKTVQKIYEELNYVCNAGAEK